MKELRLVIMSLSMAASTVSCGHADDGHGHGTDDDHLESEGLTVFPSHVYVGADESGPYATPVIVREAQGSVEWKSLDASVAAVNASGDSALVTGLREGLTRIDVESEGESASGDVTVTFYTAGQWSAGKDAYLAMGCANCHDDGPDITPSGIGKHSDAELITAIVDGLNPEGGTVEDGEIEHVFPIDESYDAYRGIVGYLRSLPPRHDEPADDDHDAHGH